MTKRDDKKSEDDIVSCKFCGGNIDVKASNYSNFKKYIRGKLMDEAFFHENCWEGEYKKSVMRSAESLINQQMENQMEMLRRMGMPA